MKVPFLDLAADNSPLRGEIDAAINAVIEASAFAGGSFVQEFEQDFAEFCRCRHAIGVGSGTEALWLALLALGVGSGDEVITVPNSFMATAEAISYSGATPVFVDVDPSTYTMNPARLEDAITSKTKAIIPVHLFGQPADMDAIHDVTSLFGIPLVEDACQAHGAEFKGIRVGAIGDIGCFSFYPGKNLGAFGEAGAVVTNNSEIDEKIRILRDHGQIRKYHHTLVGWNCRMDGIQGAVLRIKLKHLDEWNRLRREHAAFYDKALCGIPEIVRPTEAPYARHVYHLYAIRTKNRDRLIQFLAAKDIACGVHYPVAIHLQHAYRNLGYRQGSFPVAEQCASEFVSLPMFPEMTESQLQAVSDSVREAVQCFSRVSSQPI